MKEFVQRHAASVIGVLSGFDRLLFRGTLRRLANADGLGTYLSQARVLLKDFGDWSMDLTERIKRAAVEVAESAGRPVRYLPDPSVRKEEVARGIAEREGAADDGTVCVLSSVESCWSYEIHRDAAAQRLRLQARQRRCLHLYHYMIHPEMGFMHARVQTWLPFTVSVCVNGREWLSRQLDAAGIGYRRKQNCFVDLADVKGAQELMDRQLSTRWGPMLDGILARVSPGHGVLFGPASDCPVDPYWSVPQSEWATDVMFKSPKLLEALYPSLIRLATEGLKSPDTLRFLGKHVPEGRNAHPRFVGEVLTDLKDRPEGMRVKHSVNGNSVKMYDKQGSVLRVETTINRNEEFKVFRGTEAEPKNKQWRKMRKGVADLHRRAEVSQKANERYLTAMASATTPTPLKDLAEPLCRPVRRKTVRARALNPLSTADAALLEAVGRGEFAINGFRNRDVRRLLHGDDPQDASDTRRRSAATGRKLRILKAHGLIRKVAKTHRYMVTNSGRAAITALLAARQADTATLSKAA